MSLFYVFSLPIHFELFEIFSFCLHFAKFVCLVKRLQRLKQACQKSPAGTRQTYGKKLGLVKRNRKKISQIFKDYFYSPFFLLTILWKNHSWFFNVQNVLLMCDVVIANSQAVSMKTNGRNNKMFSFSLMIQPL